MSGMFVPAGADAQLPAVVSGDEAADVVMTELVARAPKPVVTATADAEPAIDLAAVAAEAAAAGYQDGLQQARQQAEAVCAAFVQAERLRAEQLISVCRRLEDEAASLAYDMAQALLACHLDQRPEAVLSVIRGALDEISEAEEAHLMLNPEDLELIGEQAAALAEPTLRLHVRADATVGRGGATVTSDAGDVDASVEGRVQRLGQALAAAQRPADLPAEDR